VVWISSIGSQKKCPTNLAHLLKQGLPREYGYDTEHLEKGCDSPKWNVSQEIVVVGGFKLQVPVPKNGIL